MTGTTVSITNALVAGELSPSLFGRQDLEKWHSGTSTCRNFFVNYRGGVVSRAGLAYVGTCKADGDGPPPRDIPFQFNIYQGYVLEFGDEYLRIKVDGAYVTEASKSSAVSSSAVFTVATHGYSVGDWVYDTGNDGFSGLTWIIDTVPTSSTFTVTDLFGNVVSSADASSGGTVARIYTVTSPYSIEDLPYLKYIQSADTMTLTCVNTDTNTEYPSYELIRSGNTSWAFTADSFAATIQAPGNLSVIASSSTDLSTWYSYRVTAVSQDTGEESVASSAATVQNNDIAINAGSNTLTWTAVGNTSNYNVYSSIPSYSLGVPVSSLYGFIGSSLAPGFVDTNLTPDFSVVPPQHSDPFGIGRIVDVTVTAGGNGNYSQSTVGYNITTSTGSGFSGTPVIENGNFSGFLIDNEGLLYDPTDTITITDSGGGIARGNFAFSGNPSDGSNIVLNGRHFNFVTTSSPSGDQTVTLGNTLAISLSAAAQFLNASVIKDWSVATYSSDATHLFIVYKTVGTVGNAFTLDNGSGGSNATRSAATLTNGGSSGSGATGTLTIGPDSGTYPGVASYFQQRRVYAASLNNPDTYWMSQPGLYRNFDSSTPVTDGDSITGTPWAQQVNGIQFMVPMPGGLIVLTGKGAWQINGGSGQTTAITPSNQNAVAQAYNGCDPHVPPIVINYDILYIQSKGSVVRDLSYNFYTNIYTGTDLTVLSNHLFFNNQIQQWAWAEEPYKLLWTLRDDGILLCLTYLKEQEVYAWTRHDTNGQFVSVCSITESRNPNLDTNTPPLLDAVYVIVKRYVSGAWRYYAERMDNRIWNNVEDCFCVDSGLAYPLTYPDATLSPSAVAGIDVSFVASASVFTVDNEGDVIRVDGGKATVTDYVSGTEVLCTITEELTTTVPNDPAHLPVPAVQGTWTISTPKTEISGLNHLEGLEVAILADGSVVPNQVVTDGGVEVDQAASVFAIGLPYLPQVQTLYLDHPAPDGDTIQNKRKNITSVGIRVVQTRGISVGADQPDQSTLQNYPTVPWTRMVEVKDRNQDVFAGTAIPLFTGDYFKNITSGWDLKGQVAFQQSYPLPASIDSVIFYCLSGDD